MRRALVVAALLGLLLLPATAAALVPQKGKYEGTTGQTAPSGAHLPVQIKLTHGGIKLKRFLIGWTASCDSGYVPLAQATRAVGVLSTRGKFHGSGDYQSSSGNLTGTQYTAQIKTKLKGQFVSERKAKGTFSATAVLTDTTTGSAVSTCTTPTVHWHAKHL